MTSGSDEFDRPEPSISDVMNAFSFDTPRTSKRRRWGKRRPDDPLDGTDGPAATTGPQPTARPAPRTPDRGWSASAPVDFPMPQLPPDLPGAEPEPGEGASAVRPYAWTRGRTKSGFDLAIETLLSTSQRGREQMTMLPVEHQAVAHLCAQTRSVAEVAALLSIPLGVARVVLGDMAGLGLVLVHQSITGAGSGPDLALMERVLSGLRRL